MRQQCINNRRLMPIVQLDFYPLHKLSLLNMKSVVFILSLLISTAAGAHPRDAFARAKPQDPGPGLVSNVGVGTESGPHHVHKRAPYNSLYLNNNTERTCDAGISLNRTWTHQIYRICGKWHCDSRYTLRHWGVLCGTTAD